MTKSSIYFILLSALITASCDPCRNLDCLSSNYDFEFRIVDGATGQDLVFGENAIFDPDTFSLYSFTGTERRNYDLLAQAERFSIRADIYQPYGALYLEYPDGKIDTLQARFKQYDSECCGRITELIELTRNSSETFSDIYEVLEFAY